MHRLFVILLMLVAAGFAQDVVRMNEVARAQAAGDRFMGSVLVAKEGTVVFEQSYGWANAEWKIPNTAATRFRIGSVTKQFTAAAILLLEAQGKLKLDDPVARFVTDAPDAWKQVTLFHLLTHTSGIPSFTSFPDYEAYKLTAAGAAATVARFRDRPLEFTPGEKHSYSNSGYVLLGYIIERITGSSYEAFLREQIFKPLGMTDSGYDSHAAVIPQRASGYVFGPDGLANAPYIDMHVPHAAGALYTTTGDLLHWTQGLFGGKLLAAASLEKMITPYKDNYAFGLVAHTVNGRKVIEHGGGIEGFNAQLAYYPESKMTVVVLANVNGQAYVELAGKLAAVVFGETVKLTSERKEIDVPAATLQRYVGVYQLTPRITNKIRFADGRLTTQLSGQAALPIFPESETKFFLKVVDAQVEFVADEQGRVTHLLQYQNGRTQKAPRISDTVVDPKVIAVSRPILESYVGTYELKPGFELAVTLEGDQLMTQATGQARVPVFAESETKFFLKVVEAQIEFVRAEKGAITHLILHQGGQDIKGPRKP